MAKKNIVNHEEIDQLLSKLSLKVACSYKSKEEYEILIKFIKTQIRSFIYKKTECRRIRLYRVSIQRDINIIKKGGPFHKVVIDSDLELLLIEILQFTQNNLCLKKTPFISIESILSRMSQAQLDEERVQDKIKENTSVQMEFDDGFQIVQLNDSKAYYREGVLMRNCLRNSYFTGGDSIVLSLRDENNKPKATIEILPSSSGLVIGEVKEKFNKPLSKENLHYILRFAQENNLEITDKIKIRQKLILKYFINKLSLLCIKYLDSK